MPIDPPNPITADAPSAPTPPRPPRRPRYSGTHPRKFQEKYKELNPDRFPDVAAKIAESGKTPAGSHRPICVDEIINLLQPAPGMIGIDATLGFGGHARALLERIQPNGKLIGVDTDVHQLPRTEARLRALGYGPDRFITAHTNYAGIPKVLASLQTGPADFVLADLGCSSMQLDDPERGFSFKTDGPLDMRMNPEKGPSAAAWLATVREDRLRSALEENGDEPHAAKIAATLCRARQTHSLTTTKDLRRLICEALQDTDGRIRTAKDPAVEPSIRRVFQAVRIAVNDEFSALTTFLRNLPEILKPSGRVAILTFHSGEDRRVKHAFKEGLQAGLYAQVAEDVIRPSREEIHTNPRAASAKLRWALRSP